MPAVAFPYETGEIDVGEGVWLTGDFTIDLETYDDGYSFRVVDVVSMGHQVTGSIRQAIIEWVETDTAPRFQRHDHKSLIRKAYEQFLADRTPDDDADDLGCHLHHQRAA